MPGRRHSLCAMIVSQAPQAYGGAARQDVGARFAAMLDEWRAAGLARGAHRHGHRQCRQSSYLM
jgi:hypothetical protein